MTGRDLGKALVLTVVTLLAACGNGAGGGSAGSGGGGGGGGGGSSGPSTEPRHRYAFNNQCVAIKSRSNQRYLTAAGASYTASAEAVADAAAFYMKPSALGQYLFYNRTGQLMTGGSALGNQALASATDAAVFILKTAGDSTAYPATPAYDKEPTVAQLDAYRGFVDPLIERSFFTLDAAVSSNRLTVNPVSNALAFSPPTADSADQQFELQPLTAASCAQFPEAQNNASGNTFKGTTPDGRVVGMADTHVHITSTTFLGGAKSGAPFHKFGVTHAVGDCSEFHGPGGSTDAVGAAFLNDLDGHNITGWPTFPEWPSRGALTHEAIYWKWLERAWLGGLRLVVNDMVDNGTLCELQRNVNGRVTERCNEMETAREQIGTNYAMQDYIDAQYGGPGKGWYRIVLSPADARKVIADGKLAVVLGIEISNLFNCQVNYKPTRTKQPFEETGNDGPLENTYQCKTTETGAPDEIKTQLDQLAALGIRQFITIHEFDNAFGGNGIFDGLILNLGNRENSGGNPLPGVPTLDSLGNLITDPFALNPLNEVPTGEFWTTYDCPTEAELAAATLNDGYLWGSSGGAMMTSLGPPAPLCPYLGQGGRHGGPLACYPARNQCNARWLTPTGLYTYRLLMEKGMIFDFDHLTIDMKTQALELAEAQDPPYPFVSTHGTFGGTTLEQTRRVLKNGGHLYPSLGNGPSLLEDMKEVRAEWERVRASLPPAERDKFFLFGFGFGTDTNGLSAQASPRSSTRVARDPVVYPFKLFSGGIFNLVPEMAALDDDNDSRTPYLGVTFNQPEERDSAGNGRTWHIDQDGSAHYGMLSEMVEELRLEAVNSARPGSITATQAQPLRDVFNSAEVYIQTWERTQASQRGILAKGDGKAVVPPGILRAAPVSP